MTISLNIQSYKRAGEVETVAILPECTIWVHAFEVKEYEKAYPGQVKELPDDLRGNLPKVKNFILQQSDTDVTVLLDDDINYIGYWQNKEIHRVGKDQILPMIEKYSLLAQDIGAKLWGINLNPDKQVYREYSPFSTLSYISSSFSCFLKGNTLSYDPRFPLKEDYDMYLQQVNTYRKVLRVNKYFYAKKSAENTGGVAMYRNMEAEKAQLHLLQKKWGSHIVKFDDGESRSHNSTKKRSMDINPILRVPIAGI